MISQDTKCTLRIIQQHNIAFQACNNIHSTQDIFQPNLSVSLFSMAIQAYLPQKCGILGSQDYNKVFFSILFTLLLDIFLIMLSTHKNNKFKGCFETNTRYFKFAGAIDASRIKHKHCFHLTKGIDQCSI